MPALGAGYVGSNPAFLINTPLAFGFGPFAFPLPEAKGALRGKSKGKDQWTWLF